MTKYLESSCLQQISGVIKVGVLPRHHTSLVSTQQALRSPSQSVPTTSALHVHTRHACSFQNARKSNHSMKQKKNATKLAGVWGHWSISSLYSFAFFLLLLSSLSSRQQPFLRSALSRSPPPVPRPSVHPHPSPYVLRQPAVPANTQRPAVACPPKSRGSNRNIPSGVSLKHCHQQTCCWQRCCAGPRNQTPAEEQGLSL